MREITSKTVRMFFQIYKLLKNFLMQYLRSGNFTMESTYKFNHTIVMKQHFLLINFAITSKNAKNFTNLGYQLTKLFVRLQNLTKVK